MKLAANHDVLENTTNHKILENLAQYVLDPDYGVNQDPTKFSFNIHWDESEAMINNDPVPVDLSQYVFNG